jgi:hypothetical protein
MQGSTRGVHPALLRTYVLAETMADGRQLIEEFTASSDAQAADRAVGVLTGVRSELRCAGRVVMTWSRPAAAGSRPRLASAPRSIAPRGSTGRRLAS